MITTTKLENLSKEELLALLKSTQQQLVASEKKMKSFERKSNKYELKFKQSEQERKQSKHRLKKTEQQLKHSKLELKQSEQKLNQSKLELEQSEQRLNQSEQKLSQSKLELQHAEQELEKLQHERDVAVMLTTEHLKLMAEITREIKCRVVNIDEVLAKTFTKQLEYIFEEGREWIQNAVTWRAQSYATGNDVKNEKVEPESNPEQPQEQDHKDGNDDKNSGEAEKSPEEKLAELQKNLDKTSSAAIKRAVTTIKNKISKTVKATPESFIGLCSDELKTIYNTPTPEPKEEKPKRKKGRQKKDIEPTTVTRGQAPADNKCPNCGAELSSESGEFFKDFGTSIKELSKVSEYVRAYCSLHVCYNCKTVHCFFDENTDLPIKPNRIIGIRLFLEACDNIAMGHPLNHLAFFVNLALQLGHSTFIDNLLDAIDIYLVPWYEEFIKKAKNAKYLLADGTPFPCLESQGRGCCQLKKDKGSDNATEDSSKELEKSFSNYILSFCNGPLSDEKFACYDFLRTRSAKAIKEVLTDDFKFSTLICDAFGGYDTIVKERNCFMQNCIVHLRRYIVNDVRPDDYASELLKLSDEEFEQLIKTKLSKGDDRLLLFSVYVAISKIYAIEGAIDFNADDVAEQILKARDDEKPLMTSLENIMENLCSRHLIISEDGKKVKKKRGDPLARCCYYWYKRREHFTLFLDDPNIPPDTNLVEQCIRPLTIIRKNSNFMCTERGIKGLSIIFTVWESLKKNGISDPAAFLEPMCRDVFKHCVKTAYTHYYFDDHDEDPIKLKKKLNTWNMQALYQDFNFQKYFDLIPQS